MTTTGQETLTTNADSCAHEKRVRGRCTVYNFFVLKQTSCVNTSSDVAATKMIVHDERETQTSRACSRYFRISRLRRVEPVKPRVTRSKKHLSTLTPETCDDMRSPIQKLVKPEEGTIQRWRQQCRGTPHMGIMDDSQNRQRLSFSSTVGQWIELAGLR